jgi:hypothetical protein
MKTLLISAAALAAATAFVPTTSALAQGVYIDGPGVGVRVGEPHHRRWEERRHWREREVRGGGCKTVTIRRDDGSVKQIRKCNY